MYSNIGGKIKGLAKAIFIIQTIATVIMGLVFIANGLDSYYLGDEAVITGVLLMIIGPLVAWISSWLLYGFGELIDKVCYIALNTHNGVRKSEAQPKVDYEKISRLEKLRSQGLITQEDYQTQRDDFTRIL